jgi:hypothetical protein
MNDSYICRTRAMCVELTFKRDCGHESIVSLSCEKKKRERTLKTTRKNEDATANICETCSHDTITRLRKEREDMRNRAHAAEESLAVAMEEHDAKDRRARDAESAHRMALEDGRNGKTTVARSVSDIIRSIASSLRVLLEHFITLTTV